MKKLLTAVMAFAIVGFNGFLLLEGAVSHATTVTGSPARLEWDVILDVTGEMALSCYTDTSTINLGTINGMTGGDLQKSRTCVVVTNNTTGWTLSINATGTPAMQRIGGLDSFADRSLTVGAWTYAPNESIYGFSVTSLWGYNGFGASTSYSGFNYTTEIVVARATTSTGAGGATSTFNFRASAGSTRNQMTGNYSSHVVVTAAALP